MTSTGKYTALLERLPNDVATLVRIVQGLTSMNTSHPPFYGVALPDERKSESHIREVERDAGSPFPHRPSAAECWTQCGTSGANPAKSGISKGDLRGLCFIAANLVHDNGSPQQGRDATLGCLGRYALPGPPLRDNEMAFFDELSVLIAAA
jgi:hypothetical protein